MIVLLALWLVLQVIDVIAIERLICHGGRAMPITGWLIPALGRDGAYSIKLALALSGGAVLALLAPPAVLGAACAVQVLVIWYRFRSIR